eukprot:TRINITY_DN21606_c0_g1_i2.p1 TRINITY_DN21606_c0_g1~~TRINITY_DN21606_c0_g1_i2.p1  ORF type:complete len:1743 (+),score=366.46 TRINITY_DN21606_c0_g1_i2:64-5292(+)
MATEQCWVPHPTEVVLPGWFVKQEDGKKVYSSESGEMMSVPENQEVKPITDSKVLLGVEDVCELDEVTDGSILHSLRTRFLRNEIYTNVSRILLAVNPFKPLNIYDEQHLEKYHGCADPATLPPHVFGVAADVLGGLASSNASQAVLISGESGAGKTESTKFVMQYVASVFGAHCHAESHGGCFEDKILEINPILEAFGNSKTPRNKNSSRFGKWIELTVCTDSMRIAKASVIDYLLEVTRVIDQGPEERNYHIFYQLVQDTSEDVKELQLSGGAQSFRYLKANPAEVPGINDAGDFDKLRQAFASLSFEMYEQDEVFKIAAGILHLGNVTFKPDEHQTEEQDQTSLKLAAEMLGCPAEGLSKCMCKKMLRVGPDVTFSPVGDKHAAQSRDSMAKLIYGRLFKWLVGRCNESLSVGLHSEKGHADALPFIGVLDIFGFESFKTNSLEQLFINLANERLQQFFNNYIFKTEINEYKAEGIEVGSITFVDNIDILEMIEGKGGLLTILDDTTTGVSSTDAKYQAAIVKAFEKNPRFVKPKFPDQPLFGVKHYAGDVQYTTTGFLTKNSAQQPTEVLELLAESEHTVLRELVSNDTTASMGKEASTTVGPRKTVKKATVSSDFRRSLQDLIAKLNASNAHFIRCLKPNKLLSPDAFDAPLVLEQLQLSGVMQAVKIRKAGYPIRQPSRDFVKRYIVILPRAAREAILKDAGSDRKGFTTDAMDSTKAAQNVISALRDLFPTKLTADGVALGKTKVFLREAFFRALEQYRRLAFIQPALDIEAAYRGHRTRVKMRAVRKVYMELKCLFGELRMPLNAALTGCTSLITDCKKPEEMDMYVNLIEDVLDRGERLPIRPPLLVRGLELRAKVVIEAGLVRRVQAAAADSTSLADMRAIIGCAKELGLKSPDVDMLEKRADRFNLETEQKVALKNTLLMPLTDIKRYVQAARDLGLDQAGNWLLKGGHEAFEKAATRQAELEEKERQIEEAKRKAAEEAERQRIEEERRKREEAEREAARIAKEKRDQEVKAALEAMQKAATEFDAKALEDAIKVATDLGIPEQQYEQQQKLFVNLLNADFLQARLAEAKGEDPTELLVRSNIIKQLEALGHTPHTVAVQAVRSSLLKNTHEQRRPSVFDSSNPAELRVAENVFGDLANFSNIRMPKDAGLLGAGAFLRYSPLRINESLTVLDNAMEAQAIRNFTNILRAMGDKPAVGGGDLQQPILDLATKVPELVDEIYVQIMKQLTCNPSVQSSAKGWQLFHAMCSRCAPGLELREFVRAFLRKATQAAVGKVSVGEQEPLAVGAPRRSTLQMDLAKRFSVCEVAERRRSNFDVAAQQFVAERPAIASDAIQQFETKAAAMPIIPESTNSQDGLVEVYMEDGQSIRLKFKSHWTFANLYNRMLKALSLKGEDEFEFFAAEFEDECSPWRLLGREMLVREAITQLDNMGQYILFAHMNLSPWQELSVDDIVCARLCYHHAMKMYLGYQLPISKEMMDNAIPEVSAGLVQSDKVVYKKKRKGKGHDRFNARVVQFKKEFQEGLTGPGVLERYVPACVLASKDRDAIAKAIMSCVERQGKSKIEGLEDGSELVMKGRAISLMQARLPDFDAYVWDSVRCVPAKEVDITQVDWSESAHPLASTPMWLPKQALTLGTNFTENDLTLLISSRGLELRPPGASSGYRMPFRRDKDRRTLTGWRPLPDNRLALAAFECQKHSGRGGGYVAKAMAIGVPEGAAEVVAMLLTRYCED